MSEDAMHDMNVTIRVHRFAPKAEPDRARRRSSSPFAGKARGGSPFGSSPSRRRIRGKHFTQDYIVVSQPGQTVLDCLLDIKRNIDPTLAFRYSCGHGICGSDAVSINGTPALLCTAKVENFAKPPVSNQNNDANPSANEGFRSTADTDTQDLADKNATDAKPGKSLGNNADSHTRFDTGSCENANNSNDASNRSDSSDSDNPNNSNNHNNPDNPNGMRDSMANQGSTSSIGIIEIAPLPGFPVLRDLIVDIDQMMNQIKKLEPYLKADGKLATTEDGKIDMFEYLQKPEELKRYELLSNCISCGVCEGSCPVYAGGEAFVGPAALIAESRFINDSRDKATDERLDAIATADGITACQSVRACSRECPRGIDVGEEMWQLTERVKNRQG
ncbi:2Fe-2S iron-sulfur cluster-binding protein [Bifidobacterium sp. ESL0728]|uniref:succinate dehydrogenase/fumarate reductase iron-sulfur subunit n=1 Tax=Bifidobacterium sp. ESL0728 TaxID=2983220 RepID=UPI0023F99218|nr:2Fe-2S iron-sulfur cluster-binding protein [Bifidobacterium sp. ESL0728]WEV59620.1 2Fe-2S iron-sulfur cluster-binding protein [Bifidobacterium sp. ESL0728]